MRKPLQSLKLAACCVNISDGRNLQVIEDIAYAAVADQNTWEKSNVASDEMTGMKSKSVVLGVHSDAIFNRSNITIAAPIEYLATSVYQACLHAFDKITLEHHTDNGHPRLGVVDLIPIHPLSSYVSLEVCGRIAHEIALRLERTVDGTSFYYFGSADKLNRGLFERRKSMNWFSCSSDFQPDLGKQSKRYGTSGIGAIPYMSVLNIMLNTNDLNIGKEIAAAIRERNSQTGLPGIQSMAFKKQNIVEIACNVETHDLQRDVSIASYRQKKSKKIFYHCPFKTM